MNTKFIRLGVYCYLLTKEVRYGGMDLMHVIKYQGYKIKL